MKTGIKRIVIMVLSVLMIFGVFSETSYAVDDNTVNIYIYAGNSTSAPLMQHYKMNNVTDAKITEYDGIDGISLLNLLQADTGYALAGAKSPISEGAIYKNGQIDLKDGPIVFNVYVFVKNDTAETSYTVRYQDNHGAQLLPDKVVNTGVYVGDSITETPPAITNYITPSSQTKLMQFDNNVFTFIYQPEAVYSVTYNGNGNDGGVVPDDAGIYNINDTVTVLGNTGGLTKSGYIFGGWTSSAFTGTKNAADTFSMPAGNVTLYAVWNAVDYGVTYDGNGNDGGVVPDDAGIYHISNTVTVFGNTGGLTKSGYTFGGWTSSAFTGTKNAADTFSMPAGNVTLYAVWNAVDYGVTYDGNGNDGGVVPDDAGIYNVNNTVTVLGNTGGLTKSGYTFGGWTSSAFTGTKNAADTFSMPAGNVTLYAVWTPIDYTVTYVIGANGTTTGTAIFSGLHYGDPFPMAPAVTPNAGWIFNGWPTRPGTVIGNMIYTAAYTPLTYTVRFFEADGVTQIGASQTVNYGGAASIMTAPAVAGSRFTGWTLTGDDPSVETRLSNVKEDIDAVAAYAPITYLVTFEDFNGNVLGTDIVAPGGDASPPFDPTREGYTFTGWSPSYNDITEDLTVVAGYRINTFLVTFVDYNGNVIDRQTVEWNTAATAPEDPVRDGFNFTGWDVPFDAITKDTTATAQYEAVQTEPVPAATPTVIPQEPIPQAGGNNSWLWWLLLIPALGLLWLLLVLWFSVIPIAEAVTDNGNGTYTVQWGYHNRKLRKYTVEDNKSVLSLLMGELISSSSNPPVEFEKGRVENVFTTTVGNNAVIEWKINRRREKVDVKKLSGK